jgi:hypothetical protein
VDAQFVAGVIVSGNPVDFSCIADIPRIQVHVIHKNVHQFKSTVNNTLK